MADYGPFSDIFGGTAAAPAAALPQTPQDYGLFDDIFNPPPRGNVAEAGRAVARGSIGMAGNTLRGVSELAGENAPDLGIGRFGKSVTGWAQERFGATPGREKEYLNQISEAVGGMAVGAAPIVAGSVLGTPATGLGIGAGLFGLGGAGQAGAEAEAHGATPGQRQAAAAGGFAGNAALGLVPGGQITKGAARLLPSLAERGIVGGIGRTGAAAAEGAAIGGAGQVLNNEIAQQTYDPSRSLGQGVGDAALVTGAAAGILHPLIGAGAPRRPAATEPPPQPEPQAQPPMLALPAPAIPMPDLTRYATGNAVPGGPSSVEGLHTEFGSRIATMAADMPPEIGAKFEIISGFRSPERQAQVNPGVTNSRHSHGIAADVTKDPDVLNWINQNGYKYGVGFPLKNNPAEINHLEPLENGERIPSHRVAAWSAANGGAARGGSSIDAALDLIAHHESKGSPLIGWGQTDLSGYKLTDTGFPDWPGKPGPKGNSTAAGLYQITRETWDPIARRLGITDFSPESQRAVATELYRTRGFEPWAPHNPELAAAIERGDHLRGGARETGGGMLALPAPEDRLALPKPDTTYGDNFLMTDSKKPEEAAKPVTAQSSPLDRALNAVSQLNPGDPVTRRLLAQLSGLRSADQIATLRDRMVKQGVVSSRDGRYYRAETANKPEVFSRQPAAPEIPHVAPDIIPAPAVETRAPQPELPPRPVGEGSVFEGGAKAPTAPSVAPPLAQPPAPEIPQTLRNYWQTVADRGDQPKPVFAMRAGPNSEQPGQMLDWSLSRRAVEARADKRGDGPHTIERLDAPPPEPEVAARQQTAAEEAQRQAELKELPLAPTEPQGEVPPEAAQQRLPVAEAAQPAAPVAEPRAALRDELYGMVRERAPSLRLRTLDELVGTIEGRASPIHGAYHTETRPGGLLEHIASVALGGPDPRAALSHEIVHFFRRSGMFTRSEWEILSGKADKWAEQFKIGERYKDQPIGVRREEAVAEAYAAWDRGDMQQPPGIRRIFGKAKEFFERIGNWLRGHGFESADDVFRSMDRGEVGGREPGAEIGGTRYHRAYHGSPHDFDAFDSGKIGTGEGAQAYGHGLYFSSKQEVAEAYNIGLSRNPVGQIKSAIKDRLGFDASDDVANGLYDLARHYNMGLDGATPDWNAVAKSAAARTPEIRQLLEGGFTGDNPRLAKFMADLADIPRGRTYQVDLAPKEHEYLDWDKPISQQSEHVLTALAKLGIVKETSQDYLGTRIKVPPNEPTGGQIYESSKLVSGPYRDQAAASAKLREAGIPGIRYLDQGSRGQGEGSHNYVIFDPSHISIEAKYQRPASVATEEQRRDLDRIMARDTRTLADRAKGFIDDIRTNTAARFKQGFLDDLAGLEQSLKQNKRSMAPLDLARLTRNHDTVMSAVMGMPTRDGWVGGALRYSPQKGSLEIVPGSKGFGETFKSTFERGEQDLWALWAITKRAKRLMAEGREHNVSAEDIAKYADLDKQYPHFREVMKDWRALNKHALDTAEATGRINKDQRSLFEREDYVPFFRQRDDGVAGPSAAGMGLANVRSGIRKLTGGEEKIADVYENMFRNLSSLYEGSMRNQAMREVVAQLHGTDALTKDSGYVPRLNFNSTEVQQKLKNMLGYDADLMTSREQAAAKELIGLEQKTDPGIVSVMENGKPQFYRVNDDLLLRSLVSMGPRETGAVMKVFGAAKGLLTKTVTIDPAFMVRNILRDTPHTWVVTGSGFTLGVDTYKGFAQALSNSPSAMALRAGGAGGGGFYGAHPENVRRMLESKDFKDSLLDSPRKLYHALERVGAASEMANRIPVFESALKEGLSHREALARAQDVLNYTMRGDNAAMRFLIETVPFMNARVQGMYRLYRGARDNPTSFLMRGGLLTAASVALWAATHDDERYKALEDWDRQNYYHFFIGDEHFRLPQPFEVGAIYSAVPMMLLDYADNGREKQLGNAFASLVSNQLNLNPVPQLFKPAVDLYSNKDSFTGRPIVNEAEARLVPELRYGPSASPTMVALAGSLGVSPDQAEHLMRGYTGTVGTYLLAASDVLADKAGFVPTQPEKRIDQLPVVSSFIRKEPALGTRWLTEFYDLKTRIDQLHNSAAKYRQEGDAEGLKGLMTPENASLMAMHSATSSAGQQLATIRRAMQQVRTSQSMDAGERRVRLDALIAARNSVASAAGRPLIQRAEGLTAAP